MVAGPRGCAYLFKRIPIGKGRSKFSSTCSWRGHSAFLPVKTIAGGPLELAPKRLQVHRQWKTGKWDFDVVDWAEN
jgi:hypothetical protein